MTTFSKSQLFVVTTATAVISMPALAVQYMTAEQAQHALFPEATSFKEANVHLNAEQMNEVQKIAGLPARSVAWRVIAAYKGDALIGHMVLDDVVGKYDLISFAVGINPDASVRQVEILIYRESHGAEIKNAAWRKQFINKTAQTGLKPGEDIANISGATLSCTHVTDGVRRIAAMAQVVLKKGP